MPKFLPFRGLHFDTSSSLDITSLTSPPYDVFDEVARAEYALKSNHNIVHVDYPLDTHGPGRYVEAAATLANWLAEGILVRDEPSFYRYAMRFTDEMGRPRSSVGVVGALEVVDEGSSEVLPHEQTTPKAKTDRLELTRATQCNLSAVWGLSLARGLTDLLASHGTKVATCVDETGVQHELERLDDRELISRIGILVQSAPVLIADGHHRYAISRTYRDECASTGGPADSQYTMTYIQELVENQLNIAAIHRLFDLEPAHMLECLASNYAPVRTSAVDESILDEMARTGTICVLSKSGEATLMRPIESRFRGIRNLDSVRLARTLEEHPHQVAYQHGLSNVLEALQSNRARSAVLIRPVDIEEIRETGRTGEVMPPKSTFFFPKLRTGLVIRQMDGVQAGPSEV